MSETCKQGLFWGAYLSTETYKDCVSFYYLLSLKFDLRVRRVNRVISLIWRVAAKQFTVYITYLVLIICYNFLYDDYLYKITKGVSEAHLHKAYKPCFIKALPSPSPFIAIDFEEIAPIT